MGQNTLNLRCWFHFSSFIGQAKVIFEFKNIWHDYTSYCLKNLKLCNILTWVKGELRLGQGNQQKFPFFLAFHAFTKKCWKDSYWRLLLRKTINSMLINEWWHISSTTSSSRPPLHTTYSRTEGCKCTIPARISSNFDSLSTSGSSLILRSFRWPWSSLLHCPIVTHSTLAGFSELAPHVPPTKVEYLHKAMDTDLNVCVVGNNGFRCPC